MCLAHACSFTSWSHAGKVTLPRALHPSPRELCAPDFSGHRISPSLLKLRTVPATPTENLSQDSTSPGSCHCAVVKPAGGREAPGRMLGATEASAGLQPLPLLTAKGLPFHPRQGLLLCPAARRVLSMSKMNSAAPKPGNKSLCAVVLAEPADTEAQRCQLPPVPLNKVLTPRPNCDHLACQHPSPLSC